MVGGPGRKFNTARDAGPVGKHRRRPSRRVRRAGASLVPGPQPPHIGGGAPFSAGSAPRG
jgi:hypothetical protein